jgi:quercetin dioxygenase-like cupin family protein
MRRTILSLLIGGTAMFLIGSQITVGQQAPATKRTDLLKTALPDIEGKDMNVWVADIPPGASTGQHSHPTPRFVYVIEGAVVYEVDGKQPQTFKTGEAYVEMPGEVHNFRNASTTQPARALGFQYANKGQPLQTNPP